jgi:hypothetical protein
MTSLALSDEITAWSLSDTHSVEAPGREPFGMPSVWLCGGNIFEGGTFAVVLVWVHNPGCLSRVAMGPQIWLCMVGGWARAAISVPLQRSPDVMRQGCKQSQLWVRPTSRGWAVGIAKNSRW